MTYRRLLKASCGHSLILFNSYSSMSAIREMLEDYRIEQPMFVMSRNDPHTLEAFKGKRERHSVGNGCGLGRHGFPRRPGLRYL